MIIQTDNPIIADLETILKEITERSKSLANGNGHNGLRQYAMGLCGNFNRTLNEHLPEQAFEIAAYAHEGQNRER